MAEVAKTKRKSVLLRLTPELLERLDAACGDVPRQRWIVGRLEEALAVPGGANVNGPVPSLGEPVEVRQTEVDRTSPASPRASSRAVEGGGQVGDPPPFGRDARPIVPPGGDGKPTIAQLIGWSGGGLTTPSAKRALEDGSWRNYRPRGER